MLLKSVEALGGAENIEKVDNCYTRLRLMLLNPDLVNETVLKQDTGASAVVKKGTNVRGGVWLKNQCHQKSR